MMDDLITVPAPAATALNDAPGNGWRRKFSLVWSVPFPGGPVDMGLLLFLVLFLDVKLAIKIPVLGLTLALSAPWRSFSALRAGHSLSALKRIPPFYPLIGVLAVAGWLLSRSSAPPYYDMVAGAALLFWILCLGAAHQVRVFADRDDRETLERTLGVFFLLNALVSVAELARIAWEVKAFNPYLYQGLYQRYFIRTGDYIHGLTFDTSTTNAMINAFGVVYFLSRRRGWMMLCCMACLLLTGSNFTNMLLLGVLAWIFAFRSDREQRGGIVLCVLMGVIFLGKVSPQNQTYVNETLARWEHPKTHAHTDPHEGWDMEDLRRTVFARHYIDSVHNEAIAAMQARLAAARRDSLAAATAAQGLGAGAAAAPPPHLWTPKPSIPQPDINTPPYQSRADTTDDQRTQIDFVTRHQATLVRATKPGLPLDGHVPGKLLALEDILAFYRQHPWKIVLGDGPGNFSSKLAFRAAGLGIAGGYPRRWTYIHPDFLRYHLDLFLAYFSKPKENHSLVNSPDSVFAQMLGEYGILGLALFGGTYLGFFVRRARRADRRRGKTNAFAWPLLALMTGAFFMGYWFEQLSIVVLFELMIYTDCV